MILLRSSLVFGLLLAFIGLARAHDIYSGIQNHEDVNCCSGTDCEPVDFRVVDRGVEFFSSRFQVWVFVAHSRVTYRALDGHQLATGKTAHWCGYQKDPNTKCANATWQSPDASLCTRCAFIDPGGA